jgi:hypothetical protein
MSTTPIFGLRYPDGGSAVQIPLDIKNLALDLEAELARRSFVRQVQRTGTGQTIPDNAFATLIGFGTQVITLNGTAGATYGAGTFSVNTDGVYEAKLAVAWPAISAAHRTIMQILLNGAFTFEGADTKWLPSGTGGQTYQSVTALLQCEAGDTVSQRVLQDSGAPQTIVDDSAVFTLRRVA